VEAFPEKKLACDSDGKISEGDITGGFCLKILQRSSDVFLMSWGTRYTHFFRLVIFVDFL
jgi:hypothetical protein